MKLPRNASCILSGLGGVALAVFAATSHAQVTPDAGALMRENQRQSMPDRVPNLAPQAVPKPVEKKS
jgi:hypothetical protein